MSTREDEMIQKSIDSAAIKLFERGSAPQKFIIDFRVNKSERFSAMCKCPKGLSLSHTTLFEIQTLSEIVTLKIIATILFTES